MRQKSSIHGKESVQQQPNFRRDWVPQPLLRAGRPRPYDFASYFALSFDMSLHLLTIQIGVEYGLEPAHILEDLVSEPRQVFVPKVGIDR